jgi:lysophospholipid acyltransferase (LPLAT)-like uncharacterized protein
LFDRLVLAAVPALGAAWLRAAHATMRLSFHGRETALPADGGPLIYAFWHAQLALMPWMQLRPPSVVPVSRSKDGEWTARLFARLGAETVRGSTTRGGATALRGMVRAARAGKDLAITPDGPKGPAERVQPGAVWLARLTERPVLPVAFAARPCLHVGSWDRMIVPLPLSRGAFQYGDLMWVPRDADERAVEAARVELERRLAGVSAAAQQHLASGG